MYLSHTQKKNLPSKPASKKPKIRDSATPVKALSGVDIPSAMRSGYRTTDEVGSSATDTSSKTLKPASPVDIHAQPSKQPEKVMPATDTKINAKTALASAVSSNKREESGVMSHSQSAPVYNTRQPSMHSDDLYENDGADEVYIPGQSFSDGGKSTADASLYRQQKSVSAQNAHQAPRSHPERTAPGLSVPNHSIISGVNTATKADTSAREVEDELRGAIRPVSNQQLTEALQLLKYDIHREMQGILKEQIRQFAIAKVQLLLP